MWIELCFIGYISLTHHSWIQSFIYQKNDDADPDLIDYKQRPVIIYTHYLASQKMMLICFIPVIIICSIFNYSSLSW